MRIALLKPEKTRLRPAFHLSGHLALFTYGYNHWMMVNIKYGHVDHWISLFKKIFKYMRAMKNDGRKHIAVESPKISPVLKPESSFSGSVQE